MEQELSIINNNFIKNRIRREIELLINHNICLRDNVKIEKNNDSSHENIIEYDISFKNSNDNKDYKLTISNNFPFKSPKLNINNKPLSFYHKITNKTFRNSLKKYLGIECFCCETILCPNNWGPQFTINDIIKDIAHFRIATRQVVVRLMIDIIKNKYLIDDVNIVEWLY